MILSDTLTAKEDTNTYERWELPAVGDGQSQSGPATAAEIESIQKQAYVEGHESGYRDGHEEGMVAGQVDVNQQAADLKKLIQALDTPFDDLDDEVVEQTAHLAIAVARQIIRRELHTDPGQVIAVVREALKALPVMARNIRVSLHPDDIGLVRDALSLHDKDDDDSQSWKIVEEPLLSRGGCKISSENSTIDASVETRLQRVITEIMGGERAHD